MDESVRSIKGIGEKTQKLLKKLKIETVSQLAHHYPRCYVAYPDPVPVSQAAVGIRCSVLAAPDSEIHQRAYGKKSVTTCLIADSSGSVFVRWFNMPYIRKTIRQGDYYVFTGTPVFKEGRLMFDQPEYCRPEDYLKKTQTFQPVYPLTAGLSNTLMRRSIKAVLEGYDAEEYLPETVRAYYDLVGEDQALFQVHFPTDEKSLSKARERIIFDEFFRFFAALSLVRESEEKTLNRHIIPVDQRIDTFISSLPFGLTGSQLKTIRDIRGDFLGTASMNRLIQGDVGSGKTIVAVIAMYAAVLSGYQAVMMAPTEVLAAQHYQSVSAYLKPYGVRVSLLTGSQSAREKRQITGDCETGKIDILVGTHAVLEDRVGFKDLALVITDEQHRFGVRQRDRLMKKGNDPHVLVMSATPIPRTLAIILYRDLDVSIMDEMPAHRLPVKNSVVGKEYRPSAWAFMRKEVRLGHQCFVICPMIEGDEKASMENVQDYAAMLETYMPPEFRIGTLSGKMNAEEKRAVMDTFASGETDILVSTTVIEVGIDVPNATVMLIENADRFGLAQLHQLRGRVGRGKAQSYCIFIAGREDPEAMERLMVAGRTNNGFEIAEEDLKLRGPGDFFGTRQSGTFDFALADIYANADILKKASEAVDHLKEEGYSFRDTGRFGVEEALELAKSI